MRHRRPPETWPDYPERGRSLRASSTADRQDDADDSPVPHPTDWQSASRSAPVMEIGQLLALNRELDRPAARRAVTRTAADETDDDLSLLDDEEDPAAPDSVMANEVREMYTARIVADLKVDTYVGRLLVQDAVEMMGRTWRYDKLLARLLSKPTKRNLDDIRRLELAREVAHRAMRNDLELIRLLRVPVGGAIVQVQAAAKDGGQVNVAVVPERGPIPKRSR
jgi:hypothetical protein